MKNKISYKESEKHNKLNTYCENIETKEKKSTVIRVVEALERIAAALEREN